MKIKVIVICFLLSWTANASRAQHQEKASAAQLKENVKIIFTNQLTADDLEVIQSKLADQGIFLDFQKIKYNKEKKLEALGFSVDFKDGFSGTASCASVNDCSFGFVRDYSENAKVSFATGCLDQGVK